MNGAIYGWRLGLGRIGTPHGLVGCIGHSQASFMVEQTSANDALLREEYNREWKGDGGCRNKKPRLFLV